MADGHTPIAPAADAPHIQDLIASRRGVLTGLASLGLLTLTGQDAGAHEGHSHAAPAGGLGFQPVPATVADAVTVPPGYTARTLVGWGDALYDGMAPFDPNALTRTEQEARFGQNNDMLALFPARYAFPKAKNQSRHILCANNEYFDPTLMFPAVARVTEYTPAQIEAGFASMGVSIVQIEKDGAGWRVVREAKGPAAINRRVTPFTPVAFEGPAKSHRWIAAAAAKVNAAEPGAPAGQVACGTLANCAGGETPWGTYLSAEENFQSYFYETVGAAPAPTTGAQAFDVRSYGYPLGRPSSQARGPAQFDLKDNPHGPALYGWTVEIDPYDPTYAPRKRTALGRRKGECATTALSRDGRCVVYSGDDQLNEFVYKFVSRRRFNRRNRIANRTLLDDGTLYVARFEADGTGRWLPLTVETATAAAARAATPVEPFTDLGDVLIRAREVARLMGATPMDRPEDVEAVTDANWVGQGPVLVVCTNNRQPEAAALSNPSLRDGAGAGPNLAGHILRIDEDGRCCAALTFRWDVFALAGDPADTDAAHQTPAGAPAKVGVTSKGRATFSGDRFACPDNICFDSARNVWIATDTSDSVFGDCNDSVLVTPLAAGAGPRPVKRFLVGPVGAEICGPMLSPDERTFFAAIQHPGENDAQGRPFSVQRWTGAAAPSSFPDGPGRWPRSAVVYVTRDDGGPVGG